MKFFYVLVAFAVLSAGSVASAQSILVEVCTNTACTNCIQPDNDFDVYLKSHSNIEAIFYHTNFPSPSDVFYKASKVSTDYRAGTFYNVQANPQAFVNGSDAGIKFPDWKAAIDGASPMSILTQLTALNIKTGIRINVDLSGTSAGKSVRLFVAVTESNISYNNTGSFGNPEGKPIWNNVFRRMLSNSDGSGTNPFVLSGSKHFEMTLDTTGTGWNVKNMRAIAFVQEDNPGANAPVHGLSAFALATASVRSTLSNTLVLAAPVPNPFNTSTSLPINLKLASKVSVTIVNELGTETTLIRDREMNAGSSSLPLELRGYPAGVYHARVFVNGVYAGSQKLVRIGE